MKMRPQHRRAWLAAPLGAAVLICANGALANEVWLESGSIEISLSSGRSIQLQAGQYAKCGADGCEILPLSQAPPQPGSAKTKADLSSDPVLAALIDAASAADVAALALANPDRAAEIIAQAAALGIASPEDVIAAAAGIAAPDELAALVSAATEASSELDTGDTDLATGDTDAPLGDGDAFRPSAAQNFPEAASVASPN